MATVFFGLHGSGDNRSSEGHDISMKVLREKLASYDVHFFGESVPVVGEGNAEWSRGYKFVVVLVGSGEAEGKFPKPGYYFIKDISPHECQSVLDIPNPR